jgi:hypothetical protein
MLAALQGNVVDRMGMEDDLDMPDFDEPQIEASQQ